MQLKLVIILLSLNVYLPALLLLLECIQFVASSEIRGKLQFLIIIQSSTNSDTELWSIATSIHTHTSCKNGSIIAVSWLSIAGIESIMKEWDLISRTIIDPLHIVAAPPVPLALMVVQVKQWRSQGWA